MLPRGTICSQSSCPKVVVIAAHVMVEAFVLQGLHALTPMPHNLSCGLASERRRRPVCTGAGRVSSFSEEFARLSRRTICSHYCC